jgi:hypothetical protein
LIAAPDRAMATLPFTDKIWVNEDRKLDGIHHDIAAALNDSLNVVVIAHFEATLAGVAANLRARPIEFHTFFAGDDDALCSDNAGTHTAQVWLALATYFRPRHFPVEKEGERDRLCALITEHHPMASKDQALIEAVTGLRCKSRVIFHAALTDGLLSYFGGERLQGLLKQLRQQDEDCLSHPVISGAIRSAQEKIDKKVGREIRAHSAQEWFKYNLRDGK